MFSLEAIVGAIFVLIIAGLIFFLLYWLVENVGIPEPFHKLARAILLIAAVFVCIAILMQLAGHPLVRW